MILYYVFFFVDHWKFNTYSVLCCYSWLFCKVDIRYGDSYRIFVGGGSGGTSTIICVCTYVCVILQNPGNFFKGGVNFSWGKHFLRGGGES